MVHPEGTKSPPGLVHHRPGAPARIVVLVSGSGTNLQALIDAESAERPAPAFGATIVAVGADRTGIQGLERAEQAGIPTFALRVKDFASREDWDRALRDKVAEYEPDLVVSAGFMKLLGPDFLAAFDGRVINTHPALSPSFPGMHGARRRPRLRREGHRLHGVLRRRRRGRRPDHRPGRRPGRGRRRRRERCTSASRRPSGRCSSTSWAGWPARAGPSTTERSSSSERLASPPAMTSARSSARWSACTTRPGWRTWPAACTRPASRWSPPAARRS